MAEDIPVIEVKPISFRTLGRTLPRLPRNKKPEFIVRMSDFAQYGFCQYTAWHLSEGTRPVLVPEIKQALEIGKLTHDELDRKHEEWTAELPKATKKTIQDRHKPLVFPRNLRVYLYHKPFLYLGKIDNVSREADGHLYITEDKTTKQLPSRPWPNHLLQVWIYCAGMASAHWRRINARYLCWQIEYYDRVRKEILGEFGGVYDTISHENLLSAIENFETIYQGNDLGFEIHPNRCRVCKYRDRCQFKTRS